MIKSDEMKRIESFNNSEFPILSVYLGMDSLQAPSDKFLTTQFHSLLHQCLGSDQRNIFENDIKRIEEYLNDYVPKARSLVIFSAGKNMWEVAEFEFSIPAKISVGTSPALDSITKSQLEYSKYMVLLVDREKARMFTVEQGEVVEQSEFHGDYVPQRKKMTGRDGAAGRSDIISRHTDELFDRHIDLSCKEAAKFAKSQDISFLLIGGRNEILSRIAESLPYELKNKLSGSFEINTNLPLNDILIESKKIAAAI